jgi:hypothetical protein
MDGKRLLRGVWVNSEYPGVPDMPQKTVNHGNGLMEFYTKVERARPTCAFQLNITDKWIDSRGNIWYRAYSPVCLIHKNVGGSFFGKIDKSGNTWELIASFGNLPIDEWDPTSNLYYYRIYYRQK